MREEMTEVEKTIAMIACKHDHAMLAVVERLTGVGSMPQSDVWAVAERIIGIAATEKSALQAAVNRLVGPHFGMSPAIERMLDGTNGT